MPEVLSCTSRQRHHYMGMSLIPGSIRLNQVRHWCMEVEVQGCLALVCRPRVQDELAVQYAAGNKGPYSLPCQSSTYDTILQVPAQLQL